MNTFALHGDHIWAEGKADIRFLPDSYSVCLEDGTCGGVYSSLPAEYAGIPVRELGHDLIVPGFSDLHLHAPQYRNLGLGMDLTLLDWLHDLTFPEEAKFREPDYAREVYGQFAEDIRRGMTTRAVVFGSAHTEATEILMELLENTGLCTYVGRVNMDRNAPDYICEPGAAFSLAETEKWILETKDRFKHTAPILTPRFVPMCSPEVMGGLRELQIKYDLPLQSHLGETPEEVAWVGELCPEELDYASCYDRFGLMDEKTVMAHCIYLTEHEKALMKDKGCFIAHCPDSNSNIRSGIAPIRRYLDLNMKVGLGTDISGGHTLDLMDTARQALSVSRLLWRLEEDHPTWLSVNEVFYLATMGGGAYFGSVGSFQPGYRFDAVAVDDSGWRLDGDSMETRLERFIYCASSENVTAKYADGEKLF